MRHLTSTIAASILLAFAGVWIFGGAMAEVAWLGELFLRALKSIIVPLVMLSMLTGITGLGDVRRLGTLGSRTLIYFGATTAAAVVLGAVVVSVLQPGAGIAAAGLAIPEKVASKRDLGLSDIVLGFVSDNVVGAMANLQMLPLIVFSLALGAVLTTMGSRARPLVELLEIGNEAMMRLVHLLMWLAPVGIFGLVGGRFGKAVAQGGFDGLIAQLSAVGAYMAAILLGLAIHAVLVLPAVLWWFGKRSPWPFARGMGTALLAAFSTASSSATLPLTLEGVEERNGVDKRAAQLVVPMGATVNMNGTALYEAVAAIFIAQAMGIELSTGQLLVVAITATLAAIGAAGIPEAGLVTMVMVLRAVDLPLEGVELILAVDWLLDRFRTAVNVWGDAVGAAVVEVALPADEAIARAPDPSGDA